MVKIIFEPMESGDEFNKGITLLEAAQSLNIGIENQCGGEGLCGKCKAKIEEGNENLSELSNSEDELLNKEEKKKGYRLLCQAKAKSNKIQVKIPEATQRKVGIILTEGEKLEFDKSPFVDKYHLKISKPKLQDLDADYERVKKNLRKKYGMSVNNIDNLIQKELPSLLRGGEESTVDFYDVTATVWNGKEIIDLEPGRKDDSYGIAFDIGSTTIVGYLIDLNSGKTEAISSILNPQIDLGEDLMSRIQYIIKKEDGRSKMRQKVLEGINVIIENVLEEANIDANNIYETLLVGNTAMHHFFHGIETKYLSESPFIPGRQSSTIMKAREAGININKSGYSYWLPNIGGWVGSDNVAVELVTRIFERKGNTLVIDIGTNGEIALGNKQKSLVTSTAAGPAFEGASIRNGTRAKKGSIKSVKIDDKTLEPRYKTISNKKPIGICGSGIIDVVAEMLKSGIIKKDGKFNEKLFNNPRLKKGEGDISEYILVEKDKSGKKSEIVITQKDIREIQKTKGAIQAGSRVLMNRMETKKIDRILLAGAFGNYIDKKSAMLIGLYPECDLEKVKALGDAALEGARIALLDKKKRREANKIPERMEFVEIAGTKIFEKNFINAMFFPHKKRSLYPKAEKIISEKTI